MTDYKLHHGDHGSFEEGHCLMEVVAHLAGEPHTDKPKCACPVLSEFGRKLNDKFTDDDLRTKCLGPAAGLLVNSRDESKVAERAFLLADLAVRRWAPIVLERRGQAEEAEKLRALDRIADAKTANAANAAAIAANAANAAANAANAANAAYYAAEAAPYAHCLEDAALCLIAILRGEDPHAIPLPEIS
jgi:hypothetical protein